MLPYTTSPSARVLKFGEFRLPCLLYFQGKYVSIQLSGPLTYSAALQLASHVGNGQEQRWWVCMGWILHHKLIRHALPCLLSKDLLPARMRRRITDFMCKERRGCWAKLALHALFSQKPRSFQHNQHNQTSSIQQQSINHTRVEHKTCLGIQPFMFMRSSQCARASRLSLGDHLQGVEDVVEGLNNLQDHYRRSTSLPCSLGKTAVSNFHSSSPSPHTKLQIHLSSRA